MASVRFLQTGDWQLGMTRHFLRGEAQARYTAARIDAVRAIGRLAAEHECDFVVAAGDVFESNLVSSQTVRRALEAMGSVPCPVYLLPGNHDPLDAAGVYDTPAFTSACPPNVVVLRQAGPHQVAAGVEIVAAPWFSKAPLGDLAAQAIAGCAADGTLRMVLAHGAVDVLDPDEHDVAAISLAGLEQALAEGVVHHVALGDRHSRLSVGRSGRVHYAGTPEVTSFVEDRPGDVLVVDADTDGHHAVQAHHIGTWSFVDLRRSVDSCADLDALEEQISACRPADRTVLRTALIGTLRLADKARLDAILLAADDLFAGRFTWDRHDDVAVLVDGEELSDLGVSGFAADAVADLVERAQCEGDAAQESRDALSLLYRLVGGGAA